MGTDKHDSWAARLARRILRHRRLIFAFWAVAFVAGMAGSGAVSNRLTFDFSLPGQPGYETAKQITRTFGNGGVVAPVIAVVTPTQGQAGALQGPPGAPPLLPVRPH